jgi:phage/plasmid-associated DNA primase
MPPKYKSKSYNHDSSDDSDDSKRNRIIGVDSGSDEDPLESTAKYRIQSRNIKELADLVGFLDNKEFINKEGDPTTNIIDRMYKKCYKIQDIKIHRFFMLLERCRKLKIRTMMTERQQEYSGIMLDFDIYQDKDKSQLNSDIFILLCQKIVKLLLKILDFGDVKKDIIYVGITRKPALAYKDEEQCYKDGFHLIIPGIKIRKSVKILLIKELLENKVIDDVFAEVEPTQKKIKGKEFERQDYLDTHCSKVPVFFVGSSTKEGSPPYDLSNIYECKIDSKEIIVYPTDKFTKVKKNKEINICNEFSLNFEAKDPIIIKKKYEVNPKYISKIEEIENKTDYKESEIVRNFGVLSTNAIHDAQTLEIKDMLDILDPKRAENYVDWFNVLCALANTSTSYKTLAEYFSRKSNKFNAVEFEKAWIHAMKGPAGGKKGLGVGSIIYWASMDNPEKWKKLRKQTAYEMLLTMIYERHLDGNLLHFHIATILHKLLKHKYITDIPEGEKDRVWYEFILDDDNYLPGELYKWKRCREKHPVSLSRYVSVQLTELFNMVADKICKHRDEETGDSAAYYQKVLGNFNKTTRKLGDTAFKRGIMTEAELLFYSVGFSIDLDKDPLIRGVANGVLKLSINGTGPSLITGYHNYKISKYTDVPYIPFNPYDPLTKEILITLRNIFPDDEPDTFDFVMNYFATTIDGMPKESMFLIMVGGGSNGKTFLVELHKSTIGNVYGVKLPINFLTAKSKDSDGPTPAVMMLKDATLASYSESDQNEVLNTSRMKELTGQETIAGRKLHQDMVNFKPKCHHLVTSNFEFDVNSSDYGTWRRILRVNLKVTFFPSEKHEHYEAKNSNHRIGNDKVTDQWTQDPDVKGRYFGFLVWIHYWLYRNYKGKVGNVPHPHIKCETEEYQEKQDIIKQFLNKRLVKVADEKKQYSLDDEIKKYKVWYEEQKGTKPAKGVVEQFQNSELRRNIKNTTRGLYLEGYRFLDYGEEPLDGEERVTISDSKESRLKKYGAIPKPEKPEEYYKRICEEYDKKKYLFDTEPKYDIDISSIPEYAFKSDSKVNDRKYQPREILPDSKVNDSKLNTDEKVNITDHKNITDFDKRLGRKPINKAETKVESKSSTNKISDGLSLDFISNIVSNGVESSAYQTSNIKSSKTSKYISEEPISNYLTDELITDDESYILPYDDDEVVIDGNDYEPDGDV